MSWIPLQHRVLVEIDEVMDKFSGSVIARLEDTKVKEQQAQVLATVLSIGPSAACDDRMEVGSKVMVAKWGGMTPPGDDNKRLRIMNDEDICAMEVSDAS